MLTPFHSFNRKDGLPLVPGQVAELKFGLLSTSTLVRKGHRIRVAIAGADKDTFARIPAEGTPQISVLRNAEYASSIQIPVVSKSNPLQTADPWQRTYSTLGMTGSIGSRTRTGTTEPLEIPTLQTSNQVIDRYVAALGGREAIMKIFTRMAKGFRINSNGADDSFESYFEHPDKTYSIRRLPLGTVISGSVGQESWNKINDEPARPLKDVNPPKANAPQYVLQNALHLRELYSDMKLKGLEKTADGSVYVIEATNTDGYPTKLCFDVRTGLLVCSIQKQKVQTISPGKSGSATQRVFADVETWYTDYRSADGVMTPFFVNTKTQSGLTTTIYTEIKNNVPVDEAVFKMPK
jgi:hypothetical protein